MLKFIEKPFGFNIVLNGEDGLMIGQIRKIPGGKLNEDEYWLEPSLCLMQKELIEITVKLKELNENL